MLNKVYKNKDLYKTYSYKLKWKIIEQNVYKYIKTFIIL